jgi:hypothetical protein
MAKTVAQRQAAYRSRRAQAGQDGNGERRLSLWVSTGASLALARLARHHKMTQRAILERLVTAEDDRVLKGIELDTPQWAAYFGVSAVTR